MTTKHTPGPWSLGERGMIEAEPRDGPLSEAVGAVAFVYGPFDFHGQANARLIAAAPDLLAACEAALRGHGRVHEDECTIGSDDNRCSCHVGMLKAAVAKAKGTP